MNTITIRTPADIPAYVEGVLGFRPTDSLVVAAVGGGPTARVDITADTCRDAVASLAPATPHWQRVIVVVYSADADLLPDVVTSLWAAYPDIDTVATVRVHDGLVYPNLDGEGIPATATILEQSPEFAARRVVDSRAALVAEAEAVEDAEEALAVAEAAYLAGTGARAWCFLDRYAALGGHGEIGRAALLRHRLSTAVDPSTV